jgi:hypothetical protein
MIHYYTPGPGAFQFPASHCRRYFLGREAYVSVCMISKRGGARASMLKLVMLHGSLCLFHR